MAGTISHSGSIGPVLNGLSLGDGEVSKQVDGSPGSKRRLLGVWVLNKLVRIYNTHR